jgi:hypothetical protein
MDSETTDEPGALRFTLGFVVATSLACSLYASFDARGLYADAAALLVVIYEGSWFLLSSTRAVVDLLREAPIVLLVRYSPATLFECGQALTFTMLTLPTMLCALCWLIAPQNRKAWILFPLASLLIGFAATSMHAVGEAAIATGCHWILLFLLLFRTYSMRGQVLFLLLCVPAFWLHEGAFPLTAVLMLAIVLRVSAAVGSPGERSFVGSALLLLAMIFSYQVYRVINPLYPGDRAHILQGLMHFEFLYADHHFNLPLVTGAVALLALSTLFFIHATRPADKTERYGKWIAVAWALFALAAMAVAIVVEQSFSPFSQLQARYHPPIISAVLGTATILLLRFRLPDRLWMNPASIFILLSLCATQAVADVVATRRWNAYVADLQSRLADGRGLIPWETTLHTANERADINYRLFEIGWIVPYTCIIFAPNGIVNAIIDLPEGTTFRPLDPERPDSLPELRGIDYAPYKRFLTDRGS